MTWGCRDFTRYEAVCRGVRFVGVPAIFWWTMGGTGGAGPPGPPGPRGTVWHFIHGSPTEPYPEEWLVLDVVMDLDTWNVYQITATGLVQLTGQRSPVPV